MSIPTLPNGHWNSVALMAGVTAYMTTLRNEIAEMQAERIARHGFDCFAVDPRPWPQAKISEYQIAHGIKFDENGELIQPTGDERVPKETKIAFNEHFTTFVRRF